MIWRCDLVPQYKLYKKEINEAIEKVLTSGRYTLGNEVRLFEENFSKYIGVKYGIGVGNATDGIILALRALDIKKGDEVITTPFTAIPTVSAIIESGATPVFVDICKDTFLINIKKIESAITDKTKAIMPVHLFGNVVDIDRIRTFTNDIPIIEDASQSHGSTFNSVQSGSKGDISIFSFYPTKNLGGYGDGGIVLTNSKNYFNKIKLLRTYGMIDYNHIVINGINSRLDELQAAILSIKLKKLDEMNLKRNKIAKFYKKNFNNTFLNYQLIEDNVYSNYHQFACLLKINRDNFMKYLLDNNIQTNIYYLLPLHLQKANKFLGYKKGDFPTAEYLCDKIIALPMYPELNFDNLEYIVGKINHYKNN